MCLFVITGGINASEVYPEQFGGILLSYIRRRRSYGQHRGIFRLAEKRRW